MQGSLTEIFTLFCVHIFARSFISNLWRSRGLNSIFQTFNVRIKIPYLGRVTSRSRSESSWYVIERCGSRIEELCTVHLKRDGIGN